MSWLHRVLLGFVFSLAATSHVLGNGWDLPVRLTNEKNIPLHPTPARVTLSHHVVTVASPSDPEVRAQGGSGGLMWKLEVKRNDGKFLTLDEIQAIHVRVQDRGEKPPLFSVWTKTGANYPVYCRYAYVERIRGYCAVFCEDYEVTESETRRTRAPRRVYECASMAP